MTQQKIYQQGKQALGFHWKGEGVRQIQVTALDPRPASMQLDMFANKGSGSAIKNLLLSEMRRFKIILPTLELQNQFAERVQAIEAQKAQAQTSLKKAEDFVGRMKKLVI